MQLARRGAGATEQVEVVIYASNTAEEITMTISSDESSAEVVEIPSDPIIVEVAGDATQR